MEVEAGKKKKQVEAEKKKKKKGGTREVETKREEREKGPEFDCPPPIATKVKGLQLCDQVVSVSDGFVAVATVGCCSSSSSSSAPATHSATIGPKEGIHPPRLSVIPYRQPWHRSAIFIVNLQFFAPEQSFWLVKQTSMSKIMPHAAYVLIKQSAEKDNEEKVQATSSPVPKTESAVPEKELAAEPIPAPVKVLPPIPEQEQRQLFKWILEEKRKVKPSDPTEKKKLDEEKALLKQFIRAKSVPSI
ncbi:hypothetical protein Cni_G07313 [Canna indica]|uniref:Uncharacterized protein n=1 Tax=Canna indica TaxID=4628 RepID=A0AAQ3JYW9_9LILI|nr:hypothetical protein Cni_G07313 [Canna indica]